MYRVFLVEDESLIRQGIKKLVSWNEYGFTFVGEAQDGELAWSLIQQEKPDIVITDIKMPFMDGLTLSRLIKQELPSTSVIILSGFDEFRYAKEAIGIGVDEYLLKPLSKEQLIDVLCKVKEKRDKRILEHNKIQNVLDVSDKDFGTLDVKKIDQRIIETFLVHGLIEDVKAFVDDYFNSIGEKALKSIIFRQYVVMHIQFTVQAFMEKISVAEELMKSQSEHQMEFVDAISSVKQAKYYTEHLITNAILIRDQIAKCKYSGMMDKVIQYMKNHFSDHDIDLTRVAQVANVTNTYFSGVFRQQMGKTFVEYLTELRMTRAKELLRCTDKNTGAIAVEVGYNDPHYFSSLFKKINGCSPRDYRSGGKTVK